MSKLKSTENSNTELALLEVFHVSAVKDEAKQVLKEKFKPYYAELASYQDKVDALIVTSPDQIQEMQEAREARLQLRKLRTSCEKLRKAEKADALEYGNLIQGIYNFIEGKITPMEKHLLKQEDFVKNQEAARIEKLRVFRENESNKYIEFMPLSVDLGPLSDPEYKVIFEGAKAQHAAKLQEEIEASAKAEELKQKNIRIQNLRNKLALYVQFYDPEEINENTTEEQFNQILDRVKISRANFVKAELEKQDAAANAAQPAAAPVVETPEVAQGPGPEKSDYELLLDFANTCKEVKGPECKSGPAQMISFNIAVLMGKVSKYIIEELDKKNIQK